ncbi:hypothetical protein G9C85_15425 [Halorubellus sp. JP-L1]|uniref:DUF7344 domain-containing protein n=1 Tax=Halorubellus sp. JP-L1 TaxID=2715753 RepID=UPI0014074B38|nr:hypothetical protein [Halorubellus sp. JP-L1]NHN43010.1 hypothetical protein [Halorubellus sp. JP-L1]
MDASEEPLAMGDVAEAVAAAENDCPERLVSSDQRKRVYVALYQNHLPQLDDVGLIEYEQSRGRVATGPALEQAAACLEMTASVDAPDGGETGGGTDGGETAVATAGDRGASSASSTDGNDDVDGDETGRVARAEGFADDVATVAAGASGVVAAVGVIALAVVWYGVLAASTVLAAVVVVSLLAFFVTVGLAHR